MRLLYTILIICSILACKSKKVTQPGKHDLAFEFDSLQIQKGQCLAGCKAYVIGINSMGVMHVTSFTRPGQKEEWERVLSAKEKEELNARIIKADLFNKKDYYNFDDLDTQSIIITYIKNNQTKLIKYKSGVPHPVYELVQQIDGFIGWEK